MLELEMTQAMKKKAAKEGGDRARQKARAHDAATASASMGGASVEPSASRKRRASSPEARRAAILAAALEEFTARGFEAARLDDVAKRAGIAKGTIYLYFTDKETLFQELVRSMVSPVLGTLEQLRSVDIPARMLVEALLNTFVREVLGTRRKDVIRLILAEGPRFPGIAEFYYREVISRVLAIVRPLLVRAVERGELASDALARFPQLIIAPGLVAIMWNALFEKHEPLDIAGMMRAHIDILFGAGRAT